MRLSTFRSGGREVVGVLGPDGYADTGYSTMVDLISAGDRGLEAAYDAQKHGHPLPVQETLAPLIPGRIFGTGINFKTHALENPNFVDPGEPIVNFIKTPHTVTGPGKQIVLPRADVINRPTGFDVTYEVELLVVLGKKAKQVSLEDADDYVFGYTLINDVTSINLMLNNSQMMLGKNIDTFAPIGPEIVTKDEFEPANGHIWCDLNGVRVQDEMLAEQLHSPEALLEWISALMTLDPGDCISTGTPRGTALWHPEHPYLKPGDVVTVGEKTLGELTNFVVSG